MIDPLKTLDEMLVECEHLPDLRTQVTSLRIWHLDNLKPDPEPEADLAPTAFDRLSRKPGESKADYRRRYDRLRHQIRRDEERQAHKDLPPLIKPTKDDWKASMTMKPAKVSCPTCGAPAGQRCRMMDKRGANAQVLKPLQPRSGAHKGRKDKFKELSLVKAPGPELEALLDEPMPALQWSGQGS